MGTPMRTTPRNAIIFALLAGTWGQPHTRRLEDATTIAPTAYEACSYVPDACVFPFTYLGVEYQTCTDVGAGATFWCSTTASYQFGASEDCGGCVPPRAAPTTAAPTTTTAPSNQPTATVAPTADATTIAPTAYEACTYVPDARLSFHAYLGAEYQTCTGVGAGAAFWCSTTASYQFGASEDCAGCVPPSAAPSPPPSAAQRRRRQRATAPGGDASAVASADAAADALRDDDLSERVIYDQATYALHGFVADVDGDGDLDALSAAEGDGALCGTGVSEVAWYENDGAMSFAHRTVSDAREMARQVFAVDVDGDGDVDVLSASLYDDTIAWHENDGLQSFAERLISTLASAARTVYAADVDGDGDVDAVAGSGSDDTVEWFENDGSQSFSGSIITSRVLVPYDVKVLDVDGDADVDVMCASGYMDEGLDDYVLNWFENDGFQSFTTRRCRTSPRRRHGRAADVDGDGDVDAVAALPGDDAVAWFENVGNYIFLQRVVVLENVDAWGVAAHDVDGDGDLDLLTAIYWNHKFAWYENDGAQSFVEHTLVESNGGQTNLGGARGAHWVGAADLDGDGDADIVGVSGLTARVSFAARYTISGDVAVAQAVSAADVDGDGDIDPIAASNYDDGIAWYENDGAQSFSGWDITKLAAGARAVFAIDVDRDGDADLLAASENDDTVAWYENDGSGVFTEHLVTTLADGADDAYAIDVDGDGDVDFLSANFDIDTVAWYENDGSESFTAHAVATYADGPESVFAVDVDGDGDVDVLSASSGDNTVAWYENGGAEETESEIASLLDSFDGDEPSLADGPSFQAHAITNAASAASPAPSSRVDVDGGGDADAVGVENDHTVAWYENDGEESFVAHIITTVADGAYDVFAIDVDGDGDVDALSASINDDTVAWYENDCGTSSPTATPAPSRPPTAAPSATPTSPAPSTPPTEAPTAAPTAAPTRALCPAGSYSGDRSAAACEPCAPGTYANGTGAYACDICPVNTYAVGGAAECAACPAGRQSGLGSDGCGYCLEGQYQTLDADSNKLCIDCDAGWYSPVGLTCAACGPGLYTPDGVQCVYCESGRFSNGTANEGCADCPAGAAAESGASACAPCAAEACDNATETCDQGSYGHAAAAASCLACPYPLVATRAAATFCDGCAAGTYWSDAVHDAWLAKGYRHEDGSQCPPHRRRLLARVRRVRRGHDCANRGNCPGSGAAGALGGDDLCAGHSGRCNECERGFYRGADGDCLRRVGVALVAFFATAAVLAAGAYAARPYVARVSFGHWDWWLTTALTLWYAAQSNVIFFKIEELSTPAPFKYVLDALDLWSNRRGAQRTPSELAAVDGPLATLTAKYRAQFYWVEVVDVFERLTLCGLTVFLFPSRPGMRVACCVLFLVFRLWLSATYKPIVNDAHRAVSLACVGYLAVCVAVAVMNLPETPPTALQETCFSSLLLAACAGVGLLARAVASRKRVHALLDRIHRRAPFDRADFEAAYGAAAAAKELQGAAPLPVWADAPAIDVLARCAPSFDDDVAARATGEGPVADDVARRRCHGATLAGTPAFARAEGGASGRADALRRVAADHAWSPWEAFRLVALWAMHGTKAEMDRRCAAFLALEPYGDYLRAERDVKADLEQPLLRRAEVAAVTDLVARGPQTARFLAEVDRLCFPELAEAGAAHRATDEAWLRDVDPGTRRTTPPRARPDAPDDAAARATSASRSRGEAGGAGRGRRCLLKCSPDVSIKKTTRMAAKIDEYEKEKGEGRYPCCAFVGDSLRASVVCEDAEAFWKTYCALKGDPDDPKQRFRVLRLKNKLGKGREPFNFHLNCFQPSTFKAPVQLEIQIWASSIMDLNDVSHWQYEVRASTADVLVPRRGGAAAERGHGVGLGPAVDVRRRRAVAGAPTAARMARPPGVATPARRATSSRLA
ncbi:hypothetical protein JL720_12720 [Aureococcus anophagefferens]|nr:hypothetical protein JL720_12720 [Aureococcus anophagefferens]